MLFSSNIFLFLFLPAFLLMYYVTHLHFRNLFISNFILLILSLFFYLWGNGYFVLLLYVAIVVTFIVGKKIQESIHPKTYLVIGILYNSSVLFYLKYAHFVTEQVLNPVFSLVGVGVPVIPTQFLPVGISFFTFMAIAYLIDIYRKKYSAASLLDFGLYLSLFPHLVAGPIVRFSEISTELKVRSVKIENFNQGTVRFIYGLGKKVILANTLGQIADKVFALPSDELSMSVAWIGILCYTMQVFFDFSGYTDMAIGLAKMFGFEFPENFNHPYRAENMTDFWRRWHMTLTRWFRDYVYIPLGGNRKGDRRMYINILLVFLLTGIWHGAAWTFIVWGLYNGAILLAERFLDHRYKIKIQGVVGNVVTFILVMVGWVLFRSTSIGQAGSYLKALFGFPVVSFEYFSPGYYLNLQTLTYLAIALVVVFIPFDRISTLLVKWDAVPRTVVQIIGCIAILAYSILLLSKLQFTPFIYFQF